MSKKINSIIMLLVLAVMVCSCGKAETAVNASPDDISTVSDRNTTEDTVTASIDTALQNDESLDDQVQSGVDKNDDSLPEDTSDISTEDKAQDDMAELAAIGDVEVENGIMTVKITVPADLSKGITQEQLDAAVGEKYQSAVLNEDGSVTYKMTKAQHREMLESLSESFEEALQGIVDDNETYSISDITHNDDFTEYDVTLDGSELGMSDSFSVMGMYMYGGMYGVFKGHNPEHVIVNFRDSEGNLIKSADSANAGNKEN